MPLKPAAGSHRPMKSSGPAFVPFQLSDEMCTCHPPPSPRMRTLTARRAARRLVDANIYRDPGQYGYPMLEAGDIVQPKYGYVFIELRVPGTRRPKLVVLNAAAPRTATPAATHCCAHAALGALRVGRARLGALFGGQRVEPPPARRRHRACGAPAAPSPVHPQHPLVRLHVAVVLKSQIKAGAI